MESLCRLVLEENKREEEEKKNNSKILAVRRDLTQNGDTLYKTNALI
jgi:hypothetical protein